MPYFEVADRLRELESRRALDALDGRGSDEDLLEQIEALRAAYVGAAVTAIASLRATLGERNAG